MKIEIDAPFERRKPSIWQRIVNGYVRGVWFVFKMLIAAILSVFLVAVGWFVIAFMNGRPPT